MRIDGSTLLKDSPVPSALATGMRIRNAAANSQKAEGVTEEKSVMPQSVAAKKSRRPQNIAAEKSALLQSTIQQRFAAEMTARLEAANPHDPPAAASLAASLNATAEEIKARFGQDKANEFMSQVLAATDIQINEVKLSGAVSHFFDQFTLAKQDSATRENLESMLESLNKGLDSSVDGEDAEADQEAGLAVNLNRFFGLKPNLADDRDGFMVRGFDAGFRRAKLKVGGEQQRADVDPATWNSVYKNLGGQEHITVADETVKRVASYLRRVAGNEDAAANVENGAPTDFLGAVATSMAILTQESGQEAAFGFQTFLNDNVAGDMVADSGDIHLKGWGLTRDYANPEAELPIPPPEPKDWLFVRHDVAVAIEKKNIKALQ